MYSSGDIAKRALIRVEMIEAEKKLSRKRMRSGILVFGVGAAILAIMILVYPFSAPTLNNGTSVFDGQVPLNAYVQPDIGAKPYLGGYEEARHGLMIPGYDRFFVTANDTQANVVLFNPLENESLFVYEILLEETAETIYVSGMIEPGMYVGDITLNRQLQKGEYAAYLVIHAYEPGEASEISQITTAVDIIAE